MEVPEEPAARFKFATQKSKLADTVRGSFFVVKGECGSVSLGRETATRCGRPRRSSAQQRLHEPREEVGGRGLTRVEDDAPIEHVALDHHIATGRHDRENHRAHVR